MSDDKLQVILSEQGIAKDEATTLVKAFGGPFKDAGLILADYKTIVVTKESQTKLMGQARKKRLALKHVRTTVENKRKELKSGIIKQGRAIDNVARFVKDVIVPAEEYLLLQEKFAEIKAAERVAKIILERTEKLLKYVDDISVYNLDDMTDEQFDTVLADLKSKHEAELAEDKRIEDERLADEEAERRENDRIRKENERLKVEADKKEALREKERKADADELAKVEAANKKTLDAERKKREDKEAKQEAADDKKEAERLEAEEADRKALLAPDKVKLNTFAKAIELIRTEKLPAVKTKQAQDVVNKIDEQLTKMFNLITEEARKL